MTRATLDNFESALLTELRAHVAERSATRRVRRTIGRRAAALAAAAAVAGAVAAGVVGLRPDPAFAVERRADGDIVVTVFDLSDAAGLERALAREGVTAEVTYQTSAVKPSDLDDGGRSAGCPVPVGAVTIDPEEAGRFTLTLDAQYVAAHDSVLHLTAAGGRTADDWMGVRVEWEGTAC